MLSVCLAPYKFLPVYLLWSLTDHNETFISLFIHKSHIYPRNMHSPINIHIIFKVIAKHIGRMGNIKLPNIVLLLLALILLAQVMQGHIHFPASTLVFSHNALNTSLFRSLYSFFSYGFLSFPFHFVQFSFTRYFPSLKFIADKILHSLSFCLLIFKVFTFSG